MRLHYVKAWTIDATMVVFRPVSASCVTMTNPAFLSSSETRIGSFIRSLNIHLIEFDVKKPRVVSSSQRSEELRA